MTTANPALRKLRSADFFTVEKSADMRYDEALRFAGVTGDPDKSGRE